MVSFKKFPHFFKKEADNILKEFVETCESLKIDVFLCDGTCLGIIRDSIYPRTDKDIDLGIICTRKEFQQLASKLKKQGFKRPAGFTKFDIYIDLSWKWSEEEWIFIKQFDQVNYNGKTYNVPHPVNKYLEWRYGFNWEKPKDNIHYLKRLIEEGHIDRNTVDAKLLKQIYPKEYKNQEVNKNRGK